MAFTTYKMVCTVVHTTENCPWYGQFDHSCPQNEQLFMAWKSYNMSTDCLSICLMRCFWPKLSTRYGFVQEDSYQSYRLSRTLPRNAFLWLIWPILVQIMQKISCMSHMDREKHISEWVQQVEKRAIWGLNWRDINQ